MLEKRKWKQQRYGNSWGVQSASLLRKGGAPKTFVPTEDSQESILKVVLGRSGSLRAPTVRSGNVFLVGYNTALYETEAPFLTR